MPKNNKIKSVLIIGAGPIIIGQACEFDYSGVQACKALKEEGIRVILVNSNPATIMTDPDMADKVYIEPIHWRNIEKIIINEKPDAILPTMGGQTALNTTLDLNRHKILQKHNVDIIGASIKSIDMAEDRELFKLAMSEIGLETPRAFIAHNYEEALVKQKNIRAGLLAHGQTQWLEIGMLLVQNPRLLLIDEPVAGMTHQETEQTAELLSSLAGKHSVVVVEHEMDFIRSIANRVTVLHEGKVLAEGSMEDVQNDPKVVEVYLGS